MRQTGAPHDCRISSRRERYDSVPRFCKPQDDAPPYRTESNRLYETNHFFGYVPGNKLPGYVHVVPMGPIGLSEASAPSSPTDTFV